MKDQASKSKFFVVFIDDEEKSVKYFAKIFSQNFNIIATTKPEEVLNIIDEHFSEVAVIISDQKMPKINGVELLTEIKKKNPNIIRIITTAYANLEDNIDAINKSNVFAYLTKPWDIEQVSTILQQALDEFELRQNYLSLSGSIAHEMRNPLNNVRQSTNFIKEKLNYAHLYEKFCCDSDNEKITPLTRKDFQEIIESIDIAFYSAKRGNIMIDIILNSIMQKPIDSSGFKDYSVTEVLNLVMTEYTFRPEEKERVAIDVKPQHDFNTHCNDTLLSYIFFNLLKNSFYYLKSHPNLQITIRSEIGEDQFNRIHFRDNGPGIPHHKLNSLFGAFTTSGKQGGTGLGLAFCKKTMTSFGGTIYCESVEGEFSEFILAFPKVAKKDDTQTTNRILFIQNRKNNFLRIKNLLEKNLNATGYDFGKRDAETLALIEKNNYDLILIDTSGSKIDEIKDLTKEIRKFGKTVPLISYLNSNSKTAAQNLNNIKFSDYLDSKMSDNSLIQAIAKWGLIKLKNTLLEENDVRQILQNKKILLADDESLNLILTTRYLEKFQLKVDGVRDGQDAIEMIKQHDYDLILLDISMPGLDGIAAIKEIRQFQQENNLTPSSIIAFTGDGSRQKIYQILSAGFDDYFIKGRDYKWLSHLLALKSIQNSSKLLGF